MTAANLGHLRRSTVDGEDGARHPGQVLAAMASGPRLRVLAAVVLEGPADASTVTAVSGLAPAEVERDLARLVAAGVVRPLLAEPARFVADPDAVAAAARVASHLRPETTPEDLGATPEQASVLRGFMVDGRLRTIPVQRTKRRTVLDFLAQRFEPGQVYKEAEVNRLLGGYHPDVAALRRFLVDEEFLERRERFYWRAGGTFEV